MAKWKPNSSNLPQDQRESVSQDSVFNLSVLYLSYAPNLTYIQLTSYSIIQLSTH